MSTQPQSTQDERDAFQAGEPGEYVADVVGSDVWRFDFPEEAHAFMRAWDLHGTHEHYTLDWEVFVSQEAAQAPQRAA